MSIEQLIAGVLYATIGLLIAAGVVLLAVYFKSQYQKGFNDGRVHQSNAVKEFGSFRDIGERQIAHEGIVRGIMFDLKSHENRIKGLEISYDPCYSKLDSDDESK